MNYAETIEYLFARLPMFHRIGAAALKPGLDNIEKLCSLIGNPELQFRSVHIAGTNGKGSTAHFISSILQEAGYKVGLFTSPHLKDFRERIKINGSYIPEKDVVEFVQLEKPQFEAINASFFEYTTAMAFWYFAKEKVDIAIIETGLGGRLDSTNIISPEVSVITSISLDHTNLLGDNITAIAGEKAGIIKPNTSVILGPNTDEVEKVIRAKALPIHAPVFTCAGMHLPEDLKLGLAGFYQQDNAKTVLLTIEALINQGWNISKEQLYQGFARVCQNTHFAGRWQQIAENPTVICDVAHNEDGLKWVVRQLADTKFDKLHFVFGMVSDKSTDKILALLPKSATYYFCQADTPRALPANELQIAANQLGLRGSSYNTVKEALVAAKNEANTNDLIFVGGSVFVVAEIL